MITAGSGERAGGEISHHQSQQQNSAFDPRRPVMQSVELHMRGAVGSDRIHVAHRGPDRVHPRNDGELRNQGQREHQADQHVARGEAFGGSLCYSDCKAAN